MTWLRARVLFVDDDPSLRELFQASFRAAGYGVSVAKDGFDALAQMREAVLPDLILTDLKMPNMSGFEFLSVVRRRFPQIPTIAISGEFEPAAGQTLSVVVDATPMGVLADALLVKPVEFKELLAKMTELLRDAPLRLASKQERAPVWVARKGDYYLLTCTECLRSFSMPAVRSAGILREVRTVECIFCKTPIQFIFEQAPEAPGLPSIKATVILCVDDDAPRLGFRQLILEAKGYKVLHATSAEQAMEIFQSNPVDLVVADHLMGRGTGIELAAALKRLRPTVPVIIFTASIAPPEGAETADAFICKGGGPRCC